MAYRTASGPLEPTRTATARPAPPAKRSSTSSKYRARRFVFRSSSVHSMGSPAVAWTGARRSASMPRTFHHGSGAETITTAPIPAATTYSQPAPEFAAIRYRIRPRQTTKAGFAILLKPGRLTFNAPLGRRRDLVENLPDHGFSRRPGRPAAHRQPVGQSVGGQRLDVLGPHEVPPARRRPRLGSAHERDGATRGDSQRDGRVVARRLGERHGVGQDLIVCLHAPHDLPCGRDLPELHDGLHLLQGTPLDLIPHQSDLRPPLRVAHARGDHEAVELALRQGIRPVELVRILGRNHEERLGEPTSLPFYRHL